MTTPAFPAELPWVSTLAWTAEGGTLVSENEVGPKDYRQTTRVPTATATVSWRFLEDDFAIFQDFWKNDLKRGHKWFTLPLPCGAGYAIHVVRFSKHRTAASEGYGYRTVQAELYVRERKLRPDTVDTYITSTPYPILVTEAMDMGFTVLGGRLGELVGYADDQMDHTFTVLSGELRTALRAYVAAQDDRMESTFNVLSGSLVDALRTYNAPQEDKLECSFAVLGGSMEEALVVFGADTEALNAGFTITSGTLA